MRTFVLIFFVISSLLAEAQSEAVFKAKVKGILKEYETNFKSQFGDPIPIGLPRISRRIQPGLLDSIDEVEVYYDTVITYISSIHLKADSVIVRERIKYLDKLLQLSLGEQFTRIETNYFFNQPGPTPMRYVSPNLEVKVVLGKFNATSYLIVLGFRKRFRT